MIALSSWTMWMAFLDRLSGAIFIPSLIFLFMLCFAGGLFKNGAPLRFFIAAAASAILFRMMLFFAGIAFEERYMLTLTILSLPLTAAGLVAAAEILSAKLSGKFSFLTVRNSLLLLTALTGIVFASKGLNPSLDKGWIKGSAAFIKESAGSAGEIVLVSESADERVAYYADASFLKIAKDREPQLRNGIKVDGIPGTLLYRGIKSYAGKLCILEGRPEGLANLENNLRNMEKSGKAVFIISETSEDKFRNVFADSGLSFPFTAIKSFKERKKLITIYRLRPE